MIWGRVPSAQLLPARNQKQQLQQTFFRRATSPAYGSWWQADPSDNSVLIFLAFIAGNLRVNHERRLVDQTGIEPVTS